MPGYPCCCPTGFNCGLCNAPEELAIDLTSLGLVDDECDFCDQITGVYVLTRDTIVGTGNACSFGYCVDDVCTIPGDTLNFMVWLRIQTNAWVLIIDLKRNSGCSAISDPFAPGIHLVYSSGTWDIGSEPDCMFLQDGNGDITLNYASIPSSLVSCTGTPPSTLKFSDAAA